MVTALSGVGVSVATAGGTWLAARASRRTARQETREDITAFTGVLNEQINLLKGDLADQRAEVDKQRRRIADQDATIGWLVVRVRSLVAYIRKAGLEPPAPDPMPERVRDYIAHIDV